MSGIVLAACICISLCCPVMAEQEKVTPPTVPNGGEALLCELAGMKQMLNSMFQTMLTPYLAVGLGSGFETKLQTLEKNLETRLTETEESLKDTKTRLAKTEENLKDTKTILTETETRLTNTETRLAATETELEATKEKLNAAEARLEGNETAGSSFVRWGRKSCTNNSQLVYSGVVGGSHYNAPGAAANPLCLTMTPHFDGTPLPKVYALLYGAEYQRIPNHHDQDVPCSVCRAAQSTTIMIPATQDCPSGWTTQYTGHLAAGWPDGKAATQYVCLDSDLENVSGGERNDDGHLFYYTVTRCGSLSCPPYVNNKVVLCVVCSK